MNLNVTHPVAIFTFKRRHIQSSAINVRFIICENSTCFRNVQAIIRLYSKLRQYKYNMYTVNIL